MSTLRARTIRLAHAHPELRPHILPILKTSGAMAEMLLDQMANDAKERTDKITSMLYVMGKTLRLVENLHPSATSRFDSFYGKIIKEGMALVASANKLLNYTDELGPQGESEEDFVTTRRLLKLSIGDWQRNLQKALAGAKAEAGAKLIEAQHAGGYALKVAEWVQNLARMELV